MTGISLKVDKIGHFKCSRGELSEWRAVRGVVSGISWLTIYLINNNTGDRYQVPIFFF